MPPNPEKRQHRRFHFLEPVSVFPVLPSKSGNIFEVQPQALQAQARDISEGGVKLHLDRPLGPGSLLKLTFEVLQEEEVEVFGKIIWTDREHCGIRFMLADPVLRKGVRALAS